MEEVPRVVPDEAVFFDGLAVPADFAVSLDDEDVFFFAERGGRQAADAGAANEVSNVLHRRPVLLDPSHLRSVFAAR